MRVSFLGLPLHAAEAWLRVRVSFKQCSGASWRACDEKRAGDEERKLDGTGKACH